MRVPVSWLREYVDLPAQVGADELAAALVRAGLEVERVEHVAGDVSGVVVGQVLSFEAEPQKNGKTVRWCQVSVGGDEPRGIVCGAANFAVGDKVAVALPGAVLPGPFPITARKTYGHVSDGMICSSRELGLGDDHSGILVLPPDAPLGADVVDLYGLRDTVLDIAVTPDRAYCLSVRGVAREAATAFGVRFRDPAVRHDLPTARDPEASEPLDGSYPPDRDPDLDGYPVKVDDPAGCDRYTVRTVSAIDPTVASPMWLQRRLSLAGQRPVSLVVDVTNYVMFGLGQPLHAFDRDKLVGAITVRAAAPGERMTTLDGVERVLDAGELLICDEQGPIALAGVMGGQRAECSATTTSVVLESAHFAPVRVTTTARRHKLPSEAAKRYERGVDHALAPAAAEVAVQLLVRLAGAVAEPGSTDVDHRTGDVVITLDPTYPARLAGRPYGDGVVVRRLRDVGCEVDDDGQLLTVRPPSWRPDLQQAADLAEEVIRLEGYDTVPAVLPRTPPGSGLRREQRLRRSVGRALAASGFAETLAYPFVGEGVFDQLGLAADDPRRRATRLVNPISDDEPLLRTTLLPGLLATLLRNVGRGAREVAVSETGLVFGPPRAGVPAAVPGVAGRPSDEVLAALDARLPEQTRHVAVALVPQGSDPAGPWWGEGRPPAWAEAVEAARVVAGAVGASVTVAGAQYPPFHPGRCAELTVGGSVVGHAGELHPRVIAALGLPARTSAMELDLDALTALDSGPTTAPAISSFPEATRDVAVLVDARVPVAAVEEALVSGAGPLLESVRLFDVYLGEPVPAGQRSLAFALRFRAPDRTLTDDEVNAARDAALAAAAAQVGAVLRS